jgi:hypothetical protein
MDILETLVKSVHESDMALILFLIAGFPTDTLSSIDKTIEFIYRISKHSTIECIGGELYHVGHIQRLTPARYHQYGIAWTGALTAQGLKDSSRLFTEPGLFGVASFTRGLNRTQLNQGLKRYIACFTDLNIDYVICPPWSDDHGEYHAPGTSGG